MTTSPLPRRPALRTAWTLTWLTFVWVALWRDPSWGTAAAGFLAAVGVVVVMPLPAAAESMRLRPIAAARFFGVFALAVVRSSLIVAGRVLTPWRPVREGIVGVTMRTTHPVVITVVNHAITLAPGTMVVDVHRDRPVVMFVHVLTLGDAAAIRAEVHRLEDLALAAFGLSADDDLIGSDSVVPDPPETESP